MVTGIVRQLESLGVDEITTRDIGGAAMEALKSIDKVAYIRFASVYRNFTEASDFEDFVNQLDELRGKSDQPDRPALDGRGLGRRPSGHGAKRR